MVPCLYPIENKDFGVPFKEFIRTRCTEDLTSHFKAACVFFARMNVGNFYKIPIFKNLLSFNKKFFKKTYLKKNLTFVL